MFWVCHSSTCKVVVLLALFHPARYSCTRSFAHVTLDPSPTLHLISDVLRQEAIETLLVLASLDPLRAEERKLRSSILGRVSPKEKAEVVIELNTFAAINTELVKSATL